MLRDLPVLHDPRVLAGRHLADDAGIYRLTDDIALVQSIDFFTPIVDDPFTYGQIAAANSLSDIYAMGGMPLTALNIAVYPSKTLPVDALTDILRGGAAKAKEAGVPIIGGHTVEGDEPMYGLSVTGVVHPDRIIKASTGQAGDLLILTKALGTGVIATALKAGSARKEDVEAAVLSMTRLNKAASQTMVSAGVHAATDITGFGLLGHLVEMARAGSLAAEVHTANVSFLEGAPDYASRGYVPAGGRSNEEYVSGSVEWAHSISERIRILLTDPQTSGGLLIAIAESDAERLKQALLESGDLADVVGRLVAGPPGHISIL